MLSKAIIHGLMILTICCVSGCRCKDSEKPTVFVPEEIKLYVDFPTGSWWVYENIGNPEIRDSIYIYDDRSTLWDSDQECLFWEQRDYYYVNLGGHNFDSLRTEVVQFSGVIEDQTDFYYLISFIKNGILGQSSTLLFYPNDKGDKANYATPAEIVNKQATQTINGVEYSNTITTFHPDPQYVISEVYAENVGVVMRVYPDSSVFVLKDYFINQ